MPSDTKRDVPECKVHVTKGQNAMNLLANRGADPADHLSRQTNDVTCGLEGSQNSGGAAAIVVMSFVFLCLFGITAVANGYGILMSLLLGWVLTIALILTGVLAMLSYSVWVDHCAKRERARSDHGGYTGWDKKMAVSSANGSKAPR